jgi:hypothetical protein
MKKIAIVTLALLVAVSAFAAEKPEGNASLINSGSYALDRSFSLDIGLNFEGFTAAGAEVSLIDPDPAVGIVNNAYGDFVLDADGINFTWCDDFMILFANADLTDLHLQIGGFSNFGATTKVSWPNGGSSAAGTQGGGLIENIDVDVTGYYVYIGNGYGSGGNGVWSGSFILGGSVVDSDDSSFGAVKALYR